MQIGEYLKMDTTQRKAAKLAAVDLLEAGYKHAPMAVLEGMCTLIVLMLHSLDLPLSTAIDRIADRYEILAKEMIDNPPNFN